MCGLADCCKPLCPWGTQSGLGRPISVCQHRSSIVDRNGATKPGNATFCQNRFGVIHAITVDFTTSSCSHGWQCIEWHSFVSWLKTTGHEQCVPQWRVNVKSNVLNNFSSKQNTYITRHKAHKGILFRSKQHTLLCSLKPFSNSSPVVCGACDRRAHTTAENNAVQCSEPEHQW